MKMIQSLKRAGLHSRCISQHFFAGVVFLGVICLTATASASCVRAGGKGGCYPTIGAAVAAASPGEVIDVKPGTYNESVVIGKSLSLKGTNPNNTFIDAAGLPNGINIDGVDNPGLHGVSVSGFTVENANFEGILVTNADNIALENNVVTGNNRSLEIVNNAPTCPGQPPFETGEDFDCGEGIHIMGVSYSIIANNLSENNSGGILISDDTGKTHDNLITGNTIQNNPSDCGITLASHAPAPGSRAPHNGIVHNTVSNNDSISNGTKGEGAGVGIFSDGSGIGLVSGNSIVGNKILNNGIPGIAFHSHVGPHFGLPADNLSDNVIAGNYISGNGADLGDTATPGPTGININSGGGGSPITGNIIWGNTIENEAVDIAVNTPADVDLHLNNLLGSGKIGVDNLGAGSVNATSNYWGCSAGPTSPECSSVSGPDVTFIPFLKVALK